MTNLLVVLTLSLLLLIIILSTLFVRHQQLLKTRAHLMREAMHNREFTFSLPTTGLFPGERALQQTLNDLGQDISRLVAQNEVESWQRLTRVLTHEIMNATTPIQSISQAYLHSPQIVGSPYEEGIRAIYETSSGLAHFVAIYRTLTQLQEPVITTVHLLQIAEALKPLYPALQWHIDIPPTVTLQADEILLRQVLINLIKNAVEAGSTAMELTWEKEKRVLYVSNNGTPIPAEMRREIFIPFFTTKSEGSGIGLSLARQLLMMQDITLTLEETAQSGYHVTFCMRPNS